MRIVGAYWTKKYNIVVIECDCDSVVHHRLDRWGVICAYCGKVEYLGNLRAEYRRRTGGSMEMDKKPARKGNKA